MLILAYARVEFEAGDSRNSARSILVIIKISIRSPAVISSGRFSVKTNFYLFRMSSAILRYMDVCWSYISVVRLDQLTLVAPPSPPAQLTRNLRFVLLPFGWHKIS